MQQGTEDRLVANYRRKCKVCGQKPTVNIKKADGTEAKLEMCGVCVFGEADCLDPENWA